MTVSIRIPIAGILIALMIAALGAGLVLISWPTLLNGHACDLTIESVGISPKREIDVGYRAKLAYGTELAWTSPGSPSEDSFNGDSWDSCDPGFLRRPRTTRRSFNLFPLMEVLAGEEPDLPSMQNAVVLPPGNYRLRPGDQLVYFRLK